MHYRPNAGMAYTSMPARKGRQENTEKPLRTANPKATQRPSSTGPRDEKKKSWEALWLAWKCTEVVTATLAGIILHFTGNKSHCPGEGSAGRGRGDRRCDSYYLCGPAGGEPLGGNQHRNLPHDHHGSKWLSFFDGKRAWREESYINNQETEILGLMLHHGFNTSLSLSTASVPLLSNGARPVLSATRVVLGRFNWGHSNETIYMKML